VIAVPVKNEEIRIQRFLRSLDRAARRCRHPVTALIFINNTSDHTVERIRDVELSIPVIIEEETLPRHLANAGNARRLCMDSAAHSAKDAVLMTTDADVVVSPEWIAAGAAGLEHAELVCGNIRVKNMTHLLTPNAQRLVKIEARYASLVHEVRFALEQQRDSSLLGLPCPHYIESGAALAINARDYLAIGGIPSISSSEDRALVNRAQQNGLRVSYSDAMTAWVSARLDGRAEDGMAACILSRQNDEDPLADQAMLPVSDLRELWFESQSGHHHRFPDRTIPYRNRLRISELESQLSELENFIVNEVRPTVQAGQMGLIDAA